MSSGFEGGGGGGKDKGSVIHRMWECSRIIATIIFFHSRLLLLRLASSEESRVLDSLQTFCGRATSLCRSKVSTILYIVVMSSLQSVCSRIVVVVVVVVLLFYSVCVVQFQRDIEQEVESVAKQRSKAYKPEDLYGIFRQKVLLYMYMYIHVYTHVCTCIYTPLHVQCHVCTCVYTCIYMYIHMYIHVHMTL